MNYMLMLAVLFSSAIIPVLKADCIVPNVSNGVVFFGGVALVPGDQISASKIVTLRCISSGLEIDSVCSGRTWAPAIDPVCSDGSSPSGTQQQWADPWFTTEQPTSTTTTTTTTTRKTTNRATTTTNPATTTTPTTNASLVFIPELKDAIVAGSISRVADLLYDSGADPNAKFSQSNHCGMTLSRATALIWMAACNSSASPELAMLLIVAGADVNARASNGYSALIYAAKLGNAETVRLLLDHGANIEERCICEYTALMWASSQGRSAVVRVLIDHGADVNVKDTSGSTPLRLARQGQYTDITRMLINAGAHD